MHDICVGKRRRGNQTKGMEFQAERSSSSPHAWPEEWNTGTCVGETEDTGH